MEMKIVTYDYIRHLKDERGMTNQQLSERSGVPLSSVHRVLSGQTDNPNFQTVCDLVIALGGSLDEMVGIRAPTPPVEKDTSGEIELLKAVIAEKEQTIVRKDKWLARLTYIVCGLVGFILIMTIIDRLNGNIGYWRY